MPSTERLTLRRRISVRSVGSRRRMRSICTNGAMPVPQLSRPMHRQRFATNGDPWMDRGGLIFISASWPGSSEHNASDTPPPGRGA
eukprot:scaffold28019_cov132-Isochrysis_galbana.AAC.5